MAEGYLGEFPVDITDSPFKDYTPKDWALYFIGSYGQIDGADHKMWTLDQVARVLHGTPVEIKQARWTSVDPEYRIKTGEPSPEYLAWVEEMKDGEEGPDTYWYEEGTPP